MKRKNLSIIIILLCSMVIIALFVVPVSAQGEGFAETFEDSQLPGWEHSPEVVVRDGVLRIAPGNFAARPDSWGDFDLTFRLRFDAPGETHIQYHTSENGAYMLIFTPDRIHLFKESGPGTEATELTSADYGDIPADDWFSVHIILTEGQHTITVNESNTLTATDPDPIPMGGLTFASHGERTTEVDDVILTILVSEIAGEAPAAQVEQPEIQPTATSAPDSWQSLLRSLSISQDNTIDLGTVGINLILAVVTSFILSRVYVYWGSSLSNRRKFAANFMLITVTTTFIILVVRSSVALSLGLVGALSIIRFRAAIKEPEELAFLFFAISLGIGFGDNQRMVTLITMVVVVLLLGLAYLLRQSQADVNMNMSVSSRNPNKVNMQQIMDALEKHCSKLNLLRYDENADALEMSFVIEFRHSSDLNQARSALMEISDELEISFMDNKGIW